MELGTRTSARRADLIERAIDLLAERGYGAITHRSVEQAAGVPHGSVTYWFGSRDGLVEAMVDQLCGESEAQAGAIAAGIEAAYAAGAAPDVETIADAVVAWIDGNRRHHLARMELELAAGRVPEVRARMTRAAEIFWRMCEPIARATGSSDPAGDGRALAAMVDGILLDRLVHPEQPRGVVVAAIARVLAPPLRTG